MSNLITGKYKNFILMLVGTFVVVLGTTLILAWWDDVVAFIRAITGIILAVAGLAILYFLSIKK